MIDLRDLEEKYRRLAYGREPTTSGEYEAAMAAEEKLYFLSDLREGSEGFNKMAELVYLGKVDPRMEDDIALQKAGIDGPLGMFMLLSDLIKSDATDVYVEITRNTTREDVLAYIIHKKLVDPDVIALNPFVLLSIDLLSEVLTRTTIPAEVLFVASASIAPRVKFYSHYTLFSPLSHLYVLEALSPGLSPKVWETALKAAATAGASPAVIRYLLREGQRAHPGHAIFSRSCLQSALNNYIVWDRNRYDLALICALASHPNFVMTDDLMEHVLTKRQQLLLPLVKCVNVWSLSLDYLRQVAAVLPTLLDKQAEDLAGLVKAAAVVPVDVLFVLKAVHRHDCILECLEWARGRPQAPDYVLPVYECVAEIAEDHNLAVMEWFWTNFITGTEAEAEMLPRLAEAVISVGDPAVQAFLLAQPVIRAHFFMDADVFLATPPPEFQKDFTDGKETRQLLRYLDASGRVTRAYLDAALRKCLRAFEPDIGSAVALTTHPNFIMTKDWVGHLQYHPPVCLAVLKCPLEWGVTPSSTYLKGFVQDEDLATVQALHRAGLNVDVPFVLGITRPDCILQCLQWSYESVPWEGADHSSYARCVDDICANHDLEVFEWYWSRYSLQTTESYEHDMGSMVRPFTNDRRIVDFMLERIPGVAEHLRGGGVGSPAHGKMMASNPYLAWYVDAVHPKTRVLVRNWGGPLLSLLIEQAGTIQEDGATPKCLGHTFYARKLLELGAEPPLLTSRMCLKLAFPWKDFFQLFMMLAQRPGVPTAELQSCVELRLADMKDECMTTPHFSHLFACVQARGFRGTWSILDFVTRFTSWTSVVVELLPRMPAEALQAAPLLPTTLGMLKVLLSADPRPPIDFEGILSKVCSSAPSLEKGILIQLLLDNRDPVLLPAINAALEQVGPETILMVVRYYEYGFPLQALVKDKRVPLPAMSVFIPLFLEKLVAENDPEHAETLRALRETMMAIIDSAKLPRDELQAVLVALQEWARSMHFMVEDEDEDGAVVEDEDEDEDEADREPESMRMLVAGLLADLKTQIRWLGRKDWIQAVTTSRPKPPALGGAARAHARAHSSLWSGGGASADIVGTYKRHGLAGVVKEVGRGFASTDAAKDLSRTARDLKEAFQRGQR
jgi:hypothetical protein